MPDERKGFRSTHLLLSGVLTSAVASVCCIGPFLLLATGISGAWMSRLMVLEAYQPLLAVISLTLVALAGWQFMRAESCSGQESQKTTVIPATKRLTVFVLALSLTLILLSSEYWIVLVAG